MKLSLVLGLLVSLVAATPTQARYIPSRYERQPASPVADSATIVASPPAGPVRGTVLPEAEAFLGIPFAEPPVGPLRWSSPVPKPAWATERDATRYSHGCMQKCDLPVGCPTAAQGMSEDCLYLNVFAPRGAVSGGVGSRPVMVFFPGGRYEQGTAGTALYDGRYIANHTDVVVVTTNYRLNVFGFLRAESIGGGNWGLEDQRLAMQWVQSNVAAFGGNASEVTIFGQSAGGTSTATHLISPPSQPLFTRAIVESNPYTLTLKDPAEAEKIGKKFSKDVGCGKDGSPDCLRGKSAEDVLAAGNKAAGGLDLLNPLLTFYPWTPVVDGSQVLGEPLELMAAGKGPNKPTIMGTVKQEGVMFIWGAIHKNLSKIDYGLITDALFKFKAGKVRDLYAPVGNGGDNRPPMARLATDYILACSTRAAMRGFANAGNPTYRYEFDHVFSYSKAAWGPNYSECYDAVCHGEELSFVFGSAGLLSQELGKNIEPTAEEVVLSNVMIGYWGNFATTGDPNRGPVSGLPTWPTYSASQDKTMHFAVPASSVEDDYHKTACDFWDTVYGT